MEKTLTRAIVTHSLSLVLLIIAVLFAGDVNVLKNDPFKMLIFIVAVVLTGMLAVIDIRGIYRDRPRLFKGPRRDEEIREYMTELFSGDGRCVVSSNDLSWVRGDAYDALMDKARSNSLELVMPKATSLSHELEAAGANTHYYGDEKYKFRSRFTVVNHSRLDAWVAIGMGTSKAHIVREIDSNSDPVFHMATDLVALAERVAKIS